MPVINNSYNWTELSPTPQSPSIEVNSPQQTKKVEMQEIKPVLKPITISALPSRLQTSNHIQPIQPIIVNMNDFPGATKPAVIATDALQDRRKSQMSQLEQTISSMERIKQFRRKGPVQAHSMTQEYYKEMYRLSEDTHWDADVMEARMREQSNEFNFIQFARDLFYHLISFGGGVIAYPFCALMESHLAALNRGFLPSKKLPLVIFMVQTVFGTLALLMHVLYFTCLRNVGSDVGTSVYTLQLLIVDVFLLLRSAVIAAKYGSLSKYELNLFRTLPSATRIPTLLIVPAWKKIAKKTMELETLLSATYSYIELPSIQLTSVLNDGSTVQKDGITAVNDTILEADEAVEWMRTHNVAISMMLAWIHFAIPGCIQAYQARDIVKFNYEWTAASTIFLVMYLICTMFFFGTNLQFILIGAIDYARRAKALEIWSRSIAILKGPGNKVFQLDLTQPTNITNWILCRDIIKNHGRQFLHRVQMNTMIYVAFLAAIMVYLLLPLVISRRLAISAIAVVCFDCLIFIVVLTMMAIPGGRCNDQQGFDSLVIQNHLLAARDAVAACEVAMRLQQVLSDEGFECENTKKIKAAHAKNTVIRECAEMFTVVIKQLELENANDPMTLLGIRASPAITNTILSIVTSGLAAVFSLISTLDVQLI